MPMMASPDLVLEFQNVPDGANDKILRYIIIYNKNSLDSKEIDRIVKKIDLKARCQILVKGNAEEVQTYKIENGMILIKGDGNYSFALSREVFSRLIKGELSIAWDKWSRIEWEAGRNQ